MTAGLRPYPDYKDSSLPWLGNVPSHWEVVRNGRLFAQRKETGSPDLPILEVSLKTGVRVRDLDNLKRKQMMSEREKYNRAVRDDIAYNMMRMWQGAVGVVPEDGLVSPAYVVARPYPEAEPRYYSYLFRTDAYKRQVDGYSRGIVKDRNRLYWEDFKRMPSCMPPREDQEEIADYLDTNAAMVRRFIRNRRRLIEVLNEQKYAIINRAVTRGLDPNAPLKPSGIDLLGEIPAHWDARSLRSLGRFSKGTGGSKDDDVTEGIPCIRYGHLYMYFSYIVPSARTFIDESRAHDYGRSRYGDVLFTASGEDMAEIGKSAANLIEGEVCCGGDIIILRPRVAVDGRFFGYASHAWHAACQKARLGRGTTIKHIYEDQLKRIWVAIPPRDEQLAIVTHIEKAIADADAMIARARDEIGLIREYRTRLIADVVTGKVDVRQVVADEQVESAVRASENSESMGKGRRANVHFKRAVFAAEIIHRLHDEPTFGHVKCEKMICLCEKRCGVDLGSTYHRQAAGPYDNRALRSIDSQIKKQKWYAAERDKQRYRYVPLESAGGHQTYFNRYFGEVDQEFTRIINLFRTATTEQCEIVATVYIAWEDLLERGGDASDDKIVDEILNRWHQSKRRIQEARWRTAIRWMREKGLTPVPEVSHSND